LKHNKNLHKTTGLIFTIEKDWDLEGVWNCGSYTIPCDCELVREVYEVNGEALKNSK